MKRTLSASLLFLVSFYPGAPSSQPRSQSAGFAVLHTATAAQVSQLGKEGCSVDPANPDLPSGLAEGEQVRLYRHDQADFALYTVFFKTESPPAITRIRLTQAGRSRIGYGTPSGERLVIRRQTVAERLTQAQAMAGDEMIEFVETTADRLGGPLNLLVLTPHGGAIEINTDKIGRRIVNSQQLRPSAILWGCQGYRAGGGAFARWHITSTALSTPSFPQLEKLIGEQREFRQAISIHGHSGPDILIGGAGKNATKAAIYKQILKQGLPANTRIVAAGMPLSGTSPGNIVNRYSTDGIQIELPLVIRQSHWRAVSDAIIAALPRP